MLHVDNNRRILCVSTTTTQSYHSRSTLRARTSSADTEAASTVSTASIQHLQQRATGASSGICFYLRHDLVVTWNGTSVLKRRSAFDCQGRNKRNPVRWLATGPGGVPYWNLNRNGGRAWLLVLEWISVPSRSNTPSHRPRCRMTSTSWCTRCPPPRPVTCVVSATSKL